MKNNSMLSVSAFVIAGIILSANSAAFAQGVDGNWEVKKIECNDRSANKKTDNMIKRPNSIKFQINGETGARVEKFNGCTKTTPWSISYPSPALIVASFNGPIQCAPASCDANCGLDLPLTVAYDVVQEGDTMEWTSIGSVDDSCTKNGQDNPITYRLKVVSH